MAGSVFDELYADLKKMLAEQNEKDERPTGWRRWVLPGAVVAVSIAVALPSIIRVTGAISGAGGVAKGDADADADAWQTKCRSCGEFFDDEDLEDGQCEDCADEDGDNYCCGIMYENGETVCLNCGDPL